MRLHNQWHVLPTRYKIKQNGSKKIEMGNGNRSYKLKQHEKAKKVNGKLRNVILAALTIYLHTILLNFLPAAA